MKSCINKIFLCILILNTCCSQFTTDEFGFNSNGFGFPRRPFNPNSGPIKSNLKVGNWLPAGQELVFSRGDNIPDNVFVERVDIDPVQPTMSPIDNTPVQPTMSPFIPVATTPSPQFLECFQKCATTSEYNPVCASNRQPYGNEQKFNCARRCGADIQIVRRASCEGLIQMQRG